MKQQKITLKVKGVSPMLFNRKSIMLEEGEEFQKQRGENGMNVEERIWREKAHVDDQDQVVIPSEWVKRSLVGSQKRNAYPIKPVGATRKDASMLTYFNSGVFFNDTVVTLKGKPVTKQTLTPHKSIVTIPKTGGSVPCMRPMVEAGWEAEIEGVICDEYVTPENLQEALEWVGFYSGWGDWRPQSGGQFGRFEAKVTKGKSK